MKEKILQTEVIINSETPAKKAIFVFAHADDLEQKAGGTAYYLARRGYEVISIVITSGENGTRSDAAEKVVSVRQKEAERAAEVLGIRKIIFLHATDGEFGMSNVEQEQVRSNLAEIIRKEKPNAIFTENINDPHHQDHTETAIQTLNAIKLAGLPNFQTQSPPLNDHRIDIFLSDPDYGTDQYGQIVPVDTFVRIGRRGREAKEQAFLCHESQGLRESPGKEKSNLSHLEMTKTWHEMRGLQIGRRYAEAFSEWHDTDHPPRQIERHTLARMLPGRIYKI